MYDLSSGKSLPEYMEEAKKKKLKLKQLDEYRNRIELIQDFEFNTSCQKVKVTEDQHYIIATGIYAPMIYDTSELSLKCERGLDSEVVQMQLLSTDYSKIAFLCADRNIELHAQYGRHFKIRIPKYGRDMIYNPFSCDLVAVGATNEIYRLNLDLGRFNTTLISESPEINCVDYSSDLNVIATGGIDGRVEFWNMDNRAKVCALTPQGLNFDDEEITALKFEQGTLNIAVGTAKGKVLLYDMRYPLPLLSLNHHYRQPIHTISFHQASRKLITADKKIIKIYDKDSGRLFTNIEPKTGVNSFEMCADSGLMFVPQEQKKIGTYFIPSLGNAPKCSNQATVNTEFADELISKQEKGGKKSSGKDAEKLMSDNRFSKMFEDTDFKIDRTSEAYKLIKPQESKKGKLDDIDSINGDDSEDDEQEGNVRKGQGLNKLFSGQVESEDEGNGEGDDDFMSKMDKKQKKKYKKSNQDKILIGKGAFNFYQKRWQILTSTVQLQFCFYFLRAIRNLNMPQKSDQSKKIKKHQHKGKHVITDQQVKEKLKSRRMVVSTNRLK